MKHTTSRTLFVWSDESPIAYRATEVKAGLFKRLGSGVVIDFGGDPGAWKVATSDHIMNLAAQDSEDGFQITKGVVRVSRILSSAHEWKEITTLAKFIENEDHPLNKTGNSLEDIVKAYEAHRSQVDAA